MKTKYLLLLGLVFFSTQAYSQTYDIVVALDGTGDYSSIQAAIDAAPESSMNRTVIYIKDGVYNTEKLMVPAEKPNISLIGESREGTIISYHIYDCDGSKCPTEDAALWDEENLRTSATLTIKGDGFIAKNLTIENTAGPVGVAQAITISADKVIFINCDITGYQDTLYTWTTEGRSYFQNCLVVGRTDYIYGGGTAFFDSCEIRSWGGGWITAPSTSAELKYGYVFNKCKITYADGSPRTGDDGTSIALGRPWHNYPKVTWMYCDMTDMINPLGWPTTWNMDYASTSDSLELYEYKNTGDGADMSGRSDWVAIRALTDTEAPDYERSVVLAGNDDWDPANDTGLVTIDAYSTIEAEDYDIMYGVRAEDCTSEGAGEIDLGYIQDGDYIGFGDVDFGIGAKSFTARVATSNSDTRIVVKLDDYNTGPIIGTLFLTSTGGFGSYESQTCDVNTIPGIHNVYLLFENGSSYLFNINNFNFTVGDSSQIAATITKQGTGSATQTIDLGDPIESFYYNWENAPSAMEEGMPKGIFDSINSNTKTIYFSGTPTKAGIYNFTVSTVGSVSNAWLTGTITVIGPPATLSKLGAGSATQTVELGNSITEFSYSWKNATTVTVSGMPEGISIDINNIDQTVTFSGAPTETGVFDYTITTIGVNENDSATGTITVTNNNTGLYENGVIRDNDSEIQIYPIPITNNEITLKCNIDGKITRVEIYNILGTLVYINNQINNVKTTLKPDITSGNYVIKITTRDKIFTRRIIVR